MERILVFISLVLVFLISTFVLMWYLSFSVDNDLPEEVSLPNLSAPVSLINQEQDVVFVDATTERDAMTALGFLHGYTNVWPVILLRQVALAGLGEWFGDSVLPIDLLVSRLGLADGARRAYERLSDEDRAVLDAYSTGLNRALSDNKVLLDEQMALLQIDPLPWEPWHSLALERLFAWLGGPPLTDLVADTMAVDVHEYAEADMMLRNWIHLHGFHESTAWAVQDDRDTFYTNTLVYGATGLPLFQEVLIRWSGVSFLATTITGTPFMPVIHSGNHHTAYFLTSERSFESRMIRDATAWPRPSFDRVRGLDGNEYLTTSYRSGSSLYLSSVYPDSSGMIRDTVQSWLLHWDGFGSDSDWPAWRSFFSDPGTRSFKVFNGSGLSILRDGSWVVRGSPAFSRSTATNVFISDRAYRKAPAYRRLATLNSPSNETPVEVWNHDEYSYFAETLMPQLLARLPDSEITETREALEFLSNWDYTYSDASIGSSIFEHWLSAFRDAAGHLPAFTTSDSLQASRDSLLLYPSLQEAIRRLRTNFGPEMSLWRWERIQPNRRYYPVWSDSSLHPLIPDLYETRFLAQPIPQSGHPTTLKWHPSVLDAPASPSNWSVWGRARSWNLIFIQRDIRFKEGFLGRYVSGLRPSPILLDMDQLSSTNRTLLTTN